MTLDLESSLLDTYHVYLLGFISMMGLTVTLMMCACGGKKGTPGTGPGMDAESGKPVEPVAGGPTDGQFGGGPMPGAPPPSTVEAETSAINGPASSNADAASAVGSSTSPSTAGSTVVSRMSSAQGSVVDSTISRGSMAGSTMSALSSAVGSTMSGVDSRASGAVSGISNTGGSALSKTGCDPSMSVG